MHKILSVVLGVVVASALCWGATALLPPSPLRTVAFVFAVMFGLAAGSSLDTGGKRDVRSVAGSVLAAGAGCYAVAHLIPDGLPRIAAYLLVIMVATGTGAGLQRLLPPS